MKKLIAIAVLCFARVSFAQEQGHTPIQVNPQDQKIDAQIQQLVNSVNAETAAQSNDLFPYALQVGRGDPTKMVQLLTQAARKPAAVQPAKRSPASVSDGFEYAKPLPEQRRP